ncbi:tripartite tricarboxylate transporter permease [Salinicola rhizosphaerae]|uniref:tripartite tricarboxylate transporter permease n=1 Tax=Salinicola rhizosphaerae TaxID=1443141 RepID=UPI00167807E8|nr:tripartite tricarboxylate transporter permease [Salinicola rhizosphaerae]
MSTDDGQDQTAVLALCLVSGLAGASLLKGVLAALLGLLLSMAGFAPTDAMPRFTFDWPMMDAGFALLPLLLGLFAVSEVLNEVITPPDKRSSPPTRFESPRFPGARLRDIAAHWVNMLRSGAIGVGVGLLPCIGANASNLLAYSAARSSSRHPERFSTGIPDGIVASETANNASIGAAMIPLMALGIPGDAVTAILLGGLMIHGIQTGPMLFSANGPLVYALFASMIVANVAMLVLSIAGIRIFIRILAVPKSILLSMVMVTCVIGAFATNNRMFDVYTLVAAGFLGFILIRMKIPFQPLVLGFILTP